MRELNEMKFHIEKRHPVRRMLHQNAVTHVSGMIIVLKYGIIETDHKILLSNYKTYRLENSTKIKTSPKVDSTSKHIKIYIILSFF